MRLRLIILLIIIFFLAGEINEDNFTVYKSQIDTYSGFYNVINEDTGEFSQYENHTLNINAGDKIIWVNRDIDTVTIISDQGLWKNNSAILEYRGQFNYIFNDPGTYTFHIDRYKKLSKQTIIVSSGNMSTAISMTTGPIVSPTITPVTTIDTTATMTTTDNTSVEDTVLIDPILTPLDILSNLKLTGIISFVIIIIMSFVIDIIRKNGEKI